MELDLAHPIVTDQCSHKVDPSKIEIKLKKQDGITWTTLEGNPTAQKTVQPIPQGKPDLLILFSKNICLKLLYGDGIIIF